MRATHASFAAAVLSSFVLAQQEPPQPAPQLQQLAPLVGSWQGSGSFAEPGAQAPSKWTARFTFRWSLGGHFLQEDLTITFEGNPAPLVSRSYMGWDRENRRYVSAVATNGCQVALRELKLLPDGTILQFMMQDQPGTTYAERSLLRVDGDKMSHTIDLLMPSGPSVTMVQGEFTRTDQDFDGAFEAPAWMKARPAEAIARLARCAGKYETKGQVVPMPGQPPVQIGGTDDFRAVWGGTVLHGHTEGAAEGVPGDYVGEVLWGFDAARGCLLGIYVSNMGEVMSMDGRFVDSGEMVATSAGTWMGQPMTQRMVMRFDPAGRPTGASSDSMIGTAPPFQSFSCTYTKKD